LTHAIVAVDAALSFNAKRATNALEYPALSLMAAL